MAPSKACLLSPAKYFFTAGACSTRLNTPAWSRVIFDSAVNLPQELL